ncbi:hypothetical protein SD961_20175 [Erwinia sp. MMLR14_017]|uniref:hypothetical protein n=1 Tax=Erwinia sp. MMLR14_017 TaxID=3093842 RepID=UPI0029907840|nr:hypothetical protein [Erwinia sp. MMLR14_017]MDW8848178.1 hypothetical protein [Erwinia sp. MMLR14_017]
MRELNSHEVQVISGAGKIQDTLSSFFGSYFSNVFDHLSPVVESVYTKDDVTAAGTDFGSRLGAAVENHVNNVINLLTSWIK